MDYVLQPGAVSGGRLFDSTRGCSLFTQRLAAIDGDHLDDACDEVLYVLSGSGQVTIGAETHDVRPGTAIFAAAGTSWAGSGNAQAVSVVVHDPEPTEASHAVIDLTAVEEGTATAGRHFLLGATPEVGCASVTQFVGLVPPGRAPDHFHTYDEVIYVLEGEGALATGGREEPIGPGTCVHLPARLVHCLANTSPTELRLLGVFRPAGSPAEAYYPDGTPAVITEEE
jgi:mannose-6-phosphate isomerase-like protein (cupin superfamily)